MHWIIFTISALVTILAGIRLTIYADKLSDTLHLGKLWIGIVLLAIVLDRLTQAWTRNQRIALGL